MLNTERQIESFTVRYSHLHRALRESMNAGVAAADIFWKQHQAAVDQPDLIRAFLAENYTDALLAAIERSIAEPARALGRGDALVELIWAAQVVAEYASTSQQLQRFGRIVAEHPLNFAERDYSRSPAKYLYEIEALLLVRLRELEVTVRGKPVRRPAR